MTSCWHLNSLKKQSFNWRICEAVRSEVKPHESHHLHEHLRRAAIPLHGGGQVRDGPHRREHHRLRFVPGVPYLDSNYCTRPGVGQGIVIEDRAIATLAHGSSSRIRCMWVYTIRFCDQEFALKHHYDSLQFRAVLGICTLMVLPQWISCLLGDNLHDDCLRWRHGHCLCQVTLRRNWIRKLFDQLKAVRSSMRFCSKLVQCHSYGDEQEIAKCPLSCCARLVLSSGTRC